MRRVTAVVQQDAKTGTMFQFGGRHLVGEAQRGCPLVDRIGFGGIGQGRSPATGQHGLQDVGVARPIHFDVDRSRRRDIEQLPGDFERLVNFKRPGCRLGGCLVGGKGTEVARRAVRIDPVQPVADVDEWRTVREGEVTASRVNETGIDRDVAPVAGQVGEIEVVLSVSEQVVGFDGRQR